jgi:DNA-binding winged helix-turn-helix (wHTH) protein
MREQTERRCCVFRFADVEVREREFSIFRSGKILPVEPKAYKALQFLLQNPGRVISER